MEDKVLEEKLNCLAQSIADLKKDLNTVAKYLAEAMSDIHKKENTMQEDIENLKGGFEANANLLSNHTDFLNILADKAGMNRVIFNQDEDF
ncbi:hypothetical protein [Campylobacter sp. CCUG 57310]|uniref:hypothetical protein n=1 Tax=Campylobacter sp. CCUG 57310 TaxID=2517362 RepID=UPI001567620E|nr:hypothetical protein [Campylobacter sp. CCUG 57310]QKF93225.1 hypothetical protein CORI_a039 [Campylobacter sp. CCUG 57310]